jgi:hypothetical protein
MIYSTKTGEIIDISLDQLLSDDFDENDIKYRKSRKHENILEELIEKEINHKNYLKKLKINKQKRKQKIQ